MDIATAGADVKSQALDTDLLMQEMTPVDQSGQLHRMPRAPIAGLAQSLEHKRMQLYMLQILIDVFILLACFIMVRMPVGDSVPHLGSMLTAVLVLPPFLIVGLYSGTYSQRTLTNWRVASVRVLWALFVGSAMLAFLAYFSQLHLEASRPVFAAGMAVSAIAMVGARMIFARWVRATWGPNTVNRLVIDAGGPPVPMTDVYRVNASEHALRPNVDDPAALDRLAQYLLNMDQVIVTCAEHERYAWSEVLKGSGVHGEVISDYARQIGALGIVHHEQSRVATLLVSTGPLSVRSRALKRGFDIIASGAALLALSPLLLLVAALIKVQDGGSIFFRQRRMGQGNRFFSIYKFRSMREDKSDADGNRSASKDDDRITRIGAFIRKTSIDELPQLINVLRGDMSLVGPRPHALGSQAGSKLFWQVDRRYWQRHSLRPGITGLAQVRGHRGATDTEEDLTARLQADLEYIQGWTIWRDVGVLFSTLKVLVHDRAF